MAGSKDMEKRKKIRALEAKRDTIMMRMRKDKIVLAETRAALKATRKG